MPVLVSNDLLGYVDGSFPCQVQYLCDAEGRTIPNPGYSAWVKTDQSVRSWLNATLTKDFLIEVYDLQTWGMVGSRTTLCWSIYCPLLIESGQLKFALLNHRKGKPWWFISASWRKLLIPWLQLTRQFQTKICPYRSPCMGCLLNMRPLSRPLPIWKNFHPLRSWGLNCCIKSSERHSECF